MPQADNLSEQKFNRINPLTLDNTVVAENSHHKPWLFVRIYDGDLTVLEARDLRDWLNKVLPQ